MNNWSKKSGDGPEQLADVIPQVLKMVKKGGRVDLPDRLVEANGLRSPFLLIKFLKRLQVFNKVALFLVGQP